MPMHALAERPRRLIVIGLVALVAVLAYANFHVLRSGIDVSPKSALQGPDAGKPPQAGNLATALDKKPAASFSDIVNRPLFSPDRKPVQRARPQEGVAAGPLDLRLVGVLQTGSGPKRALIRTSTQTRGVWVAEGEQVAGWTLRSIGDRSVMLTSGGRTHELAISTRREREATPR